MKFVFSEKFCGFLHILAVALAHGPYVYTWIFSIFFFVFFFSFDF